MGYFPFFIDIKDKRCLIVGGGSVACRKIKKLIPYEPEIHVVAEEICEEIKSIDYDGLELDIRRFEESDVEGCFFVIAATDDHRLNRKIAEICEKKGTLVNVVDSKEDCGFIFPSLFKKGELSAGITTCGASPNLSVYYRNLMERNTPSGIESILEFLNDVRPMAKEKIQMESDRKAFFKECFDTCMALNGVIGQSSLEALLEKYSSGGKKQGFVHIVGAGCSDSDLITVRGLNLIQNADTIIYDDLISDELLSVAKESCEKIYVGKRGGRDYIKQEEINALIVAKASEGKIVVRLKGGDPFVFGRGGEEIMALIENNIPFDEIPGITSAIAIPAEAGIPVTYRNLSRSFHVITGHTSDGISEDMVTLARLKGTLVFLMGLSNLESICESLMANGKDRYTPAAVISGGNSKNKAVVRSCLCDIAEKCRERDVKSPIVIVIGDVAGLELNGVYTLSRKQVFDL